MVTYNCHFWTRLLECHCVALLWMSPTQSISSMLQQPVASSIVEVRPLSTPLAAYTAEGRREWGHLELTRAIVEATELQKYRGMVAFIDLLVSLMSTATRD